LIKLKPISKDGSDNPSFFILKGNFIIQKKTSQLKFAEKSFSNQKLNVRFA